MFVNDVEGASLVATNMSSVGVEPVVAAKDSARLTDGFGDWDDETPGAGKKGSYASLSGGVETPPPSTEPPTVFPPPEKSDEPLGVV
jgi:hypothetical protein